MYDSLNDDTTGHDNFLHSRHDDTRRTTGSNSRQEHENDGDHLCDAAAVGARICDGFRLLGVHNEE